VIVIVAGVFALWHLPGYVAIALKMGSSVGSIFFDILLNFISWILFGSIYLLSGNLWLTAFAHASTDYALLPAVIQSPILGLLFMGLVVTLAWRSGYLLNCGPVVLEVSALDTIDSMGA
jgi:membrane protease YdiL (CAAX protease family)